MTLHHCFWYATSVCKCAIVHTENWRELNLVVGSQFAIANILADFNLAIRYRITIHSIEGICWRKGHFCSAMASLFVTLCCYGFQYEEETCWAIMNDNFTTDSNDEGSVIIYSKGISAAYLSDKENGHYLWKMNVSWISPEVLFLATEWRRILSGVYYQICLIDSLSMCQLR